MRDWFTSGARQSIYRTSMDVPRESYKFAMHHSTAFCDHYICIITRESMLLLFVIFIYNDLLMQMGAGSHFK